MIGYPHLGIPGSSEDDRNRSRCLLDGEDVVVARRYEDVDRQAYQLWCDLAGACRL